MDIRAEIDTKGLEQFKQFSERRLRAAIATSLTRTVNEAKKAWQAELRTKLDRPTPYTTNSIRTEPANANKLEAVVAVKDQGDGVAPAEYLGTQERGGSRRLRKFEKALVARGAMLPGQKVVPARAAKVDGYGNITRGQIVDVLRQLADSAALSPGYKKVIGNKAKKTGKYLAITGGPWLFPGIWTRVGKQLLPVFQYVSRTVYRPRIDLTQRAEDTVRQQLQAQFDRAMRESAARLAAK